MLIAGMFQFGCLTVFPCRKREIDIAPVPALNLFGWPVTISGNGIQNPNHATDSIVYGLPSCTNVAFLGNAPFVGCLYTPSANFFTYGTAYDFSGGLIADSVTLNTNLNFHYDESLNGSGPVVSGQGAVPFCRY